ncbi:MAG TPA: ABC transporter substrate-binding protein, partial [Yinghuangia sp.]|nr:ABC transporter substrate-binding protein [Yinghuangia sp.]
MTCPPLSSRRPGSSGGVPARRVLRAAVAAVCAVGMSVACSSSNGTPNAAGTPQSGGELVMGLRSDVLSLDPLTSRSGGVTDGSRMTALYDVLLWTDATTKTVHPHMAESMTADATGTNWTLRLRPEIAFSDGTVLDAAAVQFNWERQRTGTGPEVTGAAAAGQIRTMTVAPGDPLTLNITLTAPNSNFDRAVSQSLNFIASPTAAKAAGPDGLRTKPVGAGPFVLESHTPGQALVLKRNTRYWQAAKGLPHLDRITFVPRTDIQQTISEMKAGDIDLTVTRYAPDKAAAEEAGLGVAELLLDGGSMLQFNTRIAPFDNPDARLAVAYALSTAEINDRIYQGQGTPARGMFASLSPLANPQLAAPENDPRKAAQLFDKLTANGTKKLEFTYTVPTSPLSEQLARLIEAKLSAYRGVTMTVRVLP